MSYRERDLPQGPRRQPGSIDPATLVAALLSLPLPSRSVRPQERPEALAGPESPARTAAAQGAAEELDGLEISRAQRGRGSR